MSTVTRLIRGGGAILRSNDAYEILDALRDIRYL